jgi:hypothetical protein
MDVERESVMPQFPLDNLNDFELRLLSSLAFIAAKESVINV